MRARKLCSILLVAGIVAAACSSTAATPGLYDKYAPEQVAQPSSAASAASYGEVPAATAAPGSRTGGDEQSGASPGVGANAAVAESQIVKTGSISVQVAAIDESISRATEQMHALGGWLAGSDRTSSSAQDIASVTYRIPVARFEDALAAMRKLGTKVLSEHTESTPVGGQIVDLQARIANLKASEKAIQAIMAKATTIADVLTVQKRLAEVQDEIERLSAQLTALTDQATYSTLTVVFVVPILPTASPSASPTPSPSPTATPIPWSAGDQASQAAGALGEVGKAAATVLIWIAILIIPVLVVLIILLALLGYLGRVVDPFRRRLLPFSVSQPVNWAPPAMPPGGPYPPASPGMPAPAPAPGPGPRPKS
jgi:uncharacterized small protein (DUF1192 family)